MLVLGSEDQKRVLTMREAIDAVGLALSEMSAGSAKTPVRTSLPVPKAKGTALFMPSLVESVGGLGLKFVSVFPLNKQLGKETIQGVMVLADINTAEPLALLEASYLTALRTGAASGLAVKYLARKDAKVLGVIGTGAQSKYVIAAVREVRSIKEIRLYNRSLEKAEQLASELSRQADEPSIKVIVVHDANDAVVDADIVVTTTNSSAPVFNAAALKQGAHVNAVGSFRPDMQEIPTDIFRKNPKVVVESRKAAFEETGDLLVPMRQGLFSPERLHAELGDIVRGIKAGRENEKEITVFKSVGVAAMDVVVGKILYERAAELGIGQKVILS